MILFLLGFSEDRLHKCLTVEPTSVLVMGNGQVQRPAESIPVLGGLGTSSTWLLVPATTLEGMRKVKHLMVNLTIDPDSVGPMWWAIVYVPQGTTVGSINVTTSASATGMYEPNQFVMNCGIADPTAGPIRFSSPVARNLNDGDAIALVVRHTNSAARTVMGTCRYAITLQ